MFLRRKDGSELMKETTFIGIDVCKDILEVAVRSSGERWKQANDGKRSSSLVWVPA